MRYGFCTGFATTPLFTIDSTLEAAVSSWGFDYIEYPLMSIAALPENDFQSLCSRVRAASLGCDSMCNLFPSSVPVIGEQVSETQIRKYLDTAFLRASVLGVKKLIFGSAGARRRGSLPAEEADRQFLFCLQILDEYCSRYQMTVLLEAIRREEADYVNTLAEAAVMVQHIREAGSSHIALMADLYHMNENGESLDDLRSNIPLIQHIHICEANRALPCGRFSGFLQEALCILQDAHYNLTVSYESVMPEGETEGRAACNLLKKTL